MFLTTHVARHGLFVGFIDCKYNRDKITIKYEGWNFNSGNYLFITDTK